MQFLELGIYSCHILNCNSFHAAEKWIITLYISDLIKFCTAMCNFISCHTDKILHRLQKIKITLKFYNNSQIIEYWWIIDVKTSHSSLLLKRDSPSHLVTVSHSDRQVCKAESWAVCVMSAEMQTSCISVPIR